jgi:hypothetical protein
LHSVQNLLSSYLLPKDGQTTIYSQVRTQNFSTEANGPEAIYNMFYLFYLLKLCYTNHVVSLTNITLFAIVFTYIHTYKFNYIFYDSITVSYLMFFFLIYFSKF